MPVVTLSVKSSLGSRDNAWLQVLDDINSVNIDQVKDIVDKATLVLDTKLTNPLPNENINYSNKHIKDVLNKAKAFALKYKLSDTQLKNLNCKLAHWVQSDFKSIFEELSNTTVDVLLVYLNDKVGKHDWFILNHLRDSGVNVLVVTKDFSNISYAENARVIKLGTNEGLSVTNKTKKSNSRVEIINTAKSVVNIDKELLDQLEFINMVKDHSDNIIVSICGTSINPNSLVIASKLNEICRGNNNKFFIEEKIPKPTLDETSQVYKINRDNVDYIIATLKNFVRCYDKEIESLVKSELEVELKKYKASGDTSSIIYNKGTLLICWLNRYLKYRDTTIVYYGNIKDNESVLLNILSKVSSVNIIVISGNKQGNCYKFAEGLGINIVLEDSCENKPINLVSSDTSTTLAYNASKIADRTLYGENTIGLYKEGQIVDCTTKHLACTFDETVLWWNKEMFVRPGYKQGKNSVEIPVQLAVIRGVNGTEQEYLKTIQRYCCGKTTIYKGNAFYSKYNASKRDGMQIHNCTDINGTMFSEQKPYIVGGKLQTKLIKSARNFKYSFLDNNKQDFILSKIQEIIDDRMLNKPHEYKNDNLFYNTLLNITLNLDLEMIRTIQWFNYTDYNPNIVVISTDENTLTFEDTVYLRFLNKLGFDILIFVPTQYSSLEKFLNDTEYEVYDIGRANYQIDTSGLKVIKDVDYAQKQTQTPEKKGWFSKLFN